MMMMRNSLLAAAVAALLALAPLGAPAQALSARDSAAALFEDYMRAGGASAAPDHLVRSVQRHLSEGLTELIGRLNEAGAAIDADILTSLREGATAAEVVGCDEGWRVALCEVELRSAGEAGISEWSDRLFLVRSDERGWVVGDVIYGGPRADDGIASLHSLLSDAIGDGAAEP